MRVIQKNNFNYYFKEESVIVEIMGGGRLGNTYLSFNCYQLHSRQKFKQFKQVLIDSGPNEYNSVNDIYGLAREYEIRASNGYKPTVIDTIAF